MLVRYQGSGSWPTAPGKVESYGRITYMKAKAGTCYGSVRYSYSVGADYYSGEWLTPIVRNRTALEEFLEKELPVGKSIVVRYKPGAPDRSQLEDAPALPTDEILQTKFDQL
jgi:hypothetical protein